MRVAGGDYRCTPREEARFLRDADATPFDTVIEPDSDASMLDPRSLRWLQATIRERRATTVDEGDTDTVDPSEWLDRFGLAVNGQLTRAALLVCGTPASRLRIKPTPIVDMRVYATRSDDPVTAVEWIDRLVCDGNVV